MRSPSIVNWTGALISVGLLAGLGFWGYRLAVLDVSGIPVVRALEGPMRVLPDEPGGQEVLHQGLAVNTVKAEGQAAAAADTLILAPPPVSLIAADKPVVGTRPPVRVLAPSPDADAVATAANQILASLRVESIQPPPALPQALPNAAANEAENEAENSGTDDLADDTEITQTSAITPITPIAASVPGVARSLRPRPRPQDTPVAIAAAAAAAATAASADAEPIVAPEPVETLAEVSNDVDPDSIAPGTSLVQLGAFESAEVAQSEWLRIVAVFPDSFADKARVVEEATSGGRRFYRLRAMGFSDLNQARSFCSVLLVKDAGCIPLVR
ncbi:MAG: SPOR domain-containing protein [Halocynthiibacter sp.]